MEFANSEIERLRSKLVIGNADFNDMPSLQEELANGTRKVDPQVPSLTGRLRDHSIDLAKESFQKDPDVF
jgi:hypothetical protein